MLNLLSCCLKMLFLTVSLLEIPGLHGEFCLSVASWPFQHYMCLGVDQPVGDGWAPPLMKGTLLMGTVYKTRLLGWLPYPTIGKQCEFPAHGFVLVFPEFRVVKTPCSLPNLQSNSVAAKNPRWKIEWNQVCHFDLENWPKKQLWKNDVAEVWTN